MGKRPGIEWLQSLPPGRVKGADDLLGGGTTGTPPPSARKRGQAATTEPEEKKNLGLIIYGICQLHQLEYKKEYKFFKSRRWKFDWAIPGLMIAVEYEGLQSEKSGHTTLTGYTANCDKYNTALLEGWHLLRYTVMNYNTVADQLPALINIILKNGTREERR